MSIDGLHGKPNSTRFILYRNHYNEKGLLCWTEGIKELKTGKWKIEESNIVELSYGTTAYEPVYRCSVCERVTESYLRYDEPIMPEDADFPSFCPNCGARMEGIDETD